MTETRWHFSVSWKIVHEKNNWFLVTFVVYNSRYLFFKFYLFFLDKNYNPQLVHQGKGKSTPFILLLVSWKSANILPSISSIKYSLIHWNQSCIVWACISPITRTIFSWSNQTTMACKCHFTWMKKNWIVLFKSLQRIQSYLYKLWIRGSKFGSLVVTFVFSYNFGSLVIALGS